MKFLSLHGSTGNIEYTNYIALQIFHTIIIPDFLSFVKDAATPSIIVPLLYQISNMPFHSKKKKDRTFCDLGIFCRNFGFWVKFGCAKWCYASHSDVARFVRSEVMCSISRAEGTLHFRRKHHARSAHHVPLAEHIVEKKKKTTYSWSFLFSGSPDRAWTCDISDRFRLPSSCEHSGDDTAVA